MSEMLFTFEDLESGTRRSIIAPTEAAARLRLGAIWTEVERTTAKMPRDKADWPEVYRETQVAEEQAYHKMLAANPMGQRLTTPEALATFNAATERYSKLRAHREELLHLFSSQRTADDPDI
jgi:hypothetical protein